MTTATISRPDVLPALDRKDDGELLEVLHARAGDDSERTAACEILVGRYDSLVRSCVQRYRDSPELVEDLMQVGYVGLLKAINNFDPEIGSSLAAYAQPCISGELKRHFRDKRWQVHVKRSAQELLLQLRTAREDLTQRLGRAPADEELAEHLGVGIDELLDARRADMVFHSRSLDAPLSGQDDPSLADLLGQEDPGVEHALDMAAVQAHWNELPAREQRILTLRFYGNMTQAQIGEQLGISQMHVSRLLARALGYLRRCLLSSEEEQAEPAAEGA
ncbi:MAG: SigB/SigF/SigG family RNA polymerase sigma factor [Actinobacteria bacterium]|nr:SigB/SigF/SigG family RNA polymerase sigma factor [Actinomycetota bacterium]MBO0786030.1 SigB/SigF/SigG family RNA polymerase sigma factor [Actinomycetota bacterium]MBO0818455.1 SigB/SigF/SigG family RNA polymerase sigma factor [Actinomycetota bacterium]